MHFEPGEIDILAPQTHVDPWPLYTWLREEAPVYRDARGIYVVSRYDDIVAISRDPQTYTSVEGNRPLLPPDHSFIHLDGDEHRKRRALVSDWFGPRAMGTLAGHIRDVTNDLVDRVIEEGRTEFVEDVAAPLPALIMCEMTGVPGELADDVREWLDVFMTAGNGPEHVTEEVNDAFFKFGLLHMDLVEERRAAPKDDLLSLWVNARIDDKPLNEDQLLFEHTMIMIGGSETSRNAISGGVLALARHPDQRQWLLENPDGMRNAVEEIIRWTTPFVSMSRTTTCDVTLHGQLIPAGSCIKMLYPPANRDPRHFDDAESFDIQRVFKKGQIAFGYGPHFCLGARLARLEIQVVLETLLARLPDWQVDGEPVRRVSSFIQGFSRMPLRFSPGRRTQLEAS